MGRVIGIVVLVLSLSLSGCNLSIFGDPPDAPDSLLVSASGVTQVYVSWSDMSDNERSFELERRIDSGGFALLASLEKNTAEYFDVDVSEGHTYTYRVRAVNRRGESEWPGEGSVFLGVLPVASVPVAPGGLVASPVSETSIELSWTDNSVDETSFRIERKTGADGAFAAIATRETNSTGYVDGALESGTTFFYRVCAINAAGRSSWSNQASASTPGIPGAPTGLTASATGATTIEIVWSDISGNDTGFQIQRKEGALGTYSTIATTAPDATFYADSALSSGRIYYYQVRATGVAGDSAWCSEAFAATDVPYTLSGTWESIDPSDAFVAGSGQAAALSTTASSGVHGGIDVLRTGPTILRPIPEPDGIIVKYQSGMMRTQAATDRIAVYGQETRIRTAASFAISRVEPDLGAGKAFEEIIEYYNGLPGVEYAEPDYYAVAYGTPNDSYFPYQWSFSQLGMPTVWDSVVGDGGVVVAVVDTGVAQYLSDLSSTLFVAGHDFINDDSNPDDDNQHGTHVAGTIAQSTNDGAGCAGMAYGVTIMPVKVLGQDGTGSYSAIAAGITWATDNGADVINLSLGGAWYSQTLEDAVAYAYNQGVAVFAATGNDDGPIGYPALHDAHVMAVGATDYAKGRSYYSNYGASIDIVAPGGDVTVDLDGDTYPDGILQQTFAGYNPDTGLTDYTPGHFFFQGTSMATPHVSALAALLLSQDDTLTPSEIFAVITSTAEDLGDPGWDQYTGYGLISPVEALLGEPPSTVSISDSVSDALNPLGAVEHDWIIQADAGTIDLTLEFEHAEGDLDLYLYRGVTLVDSSLSVSDDETISYSVGMAGGEYTVRVLLYQE
jgi:serine protease